MRHLKWNVNPFGGAVVDPKSVPVEPDEFLEAIEVATKQWKIDSVKVVWLEVPQNRFSLLSLILARGFTFHHANSDYAMLTLSLVPMSFVPPYATHFIGVGGVVINEKKEILVVSERYRSSGRAPSYKLPGGALVQAEHIQDAAVREVLEETGIKTVFESLICFRHWHQYRYDKSDIYFVARLRPLNSEILMQEEEIAECLWMPVEKYLVNDSIHGFNKAIVQAALNNEGLISSSMEGYEPRERYEFFMPDNNLR